MITDRKPIGVKNKQTDMLEKHLDETLVMNILEFANQIKKKGDIVTQREGITTQQWLIMLLLGGDRNHPYIEKGNHKRALMASEIADALGVSRPNITNILSSLIEKGLITQLEDENDRRRKRLTLTENATQMLERIEPLRRRANNKLFAHFSDDEKETILIFMKRCIEILEK
jgi:DNA-binding MarR family transcriptional regulator